MLNKIKLLLIGWLKCLVLAYLDYTILQTMLA